MHTHPHLHEKKKVHNQKGAFGRGSNLKRVIYDHGEFEKKVHKRDEK